MAILSKVIGFSARGGGNARWSGLSLVYKNYLNATAQLGRKFERGLLRAGLIILRCSQEKTPVWTGNLKNSGYVKLTGKGLTADVQIGYTAFYALFVHESVAMNEQSTAVGRQFLGPNSKGQCKIP